MQANTGQKTPNTGTFHIVNGFQLKYLMQARLIKRLQKKLQKKKWKKKKILENAENG